MPANDPTTLIIPTLWFKANVTLPVADPDLPGSYTIDFGEFEKAQLRVGGELKEAFTAVGGSLGLALKRRVKGKLSYEGDLKFLPPAFLAYLMGSASGGAPNPGKVVDLYGWVGMQMEGETIVGAGNTNEGEGILVHHSFKAGLTIDGDIGANGDDFSAAKFMLDVYLGVARGIWTAGTRPITATPSGG